MSIGESFAGFRQPYYGLDGGGRNPKKKKKPTHARTHTNGGREIFFCGEILRPHYYSVHHPLGTSAALGGCDDAMRI